MATAAKRKRAKRIAGITGDAAALGVTRQHLGLVLHGDRESKPLARRYRELKRQQRATKTAQLFPPAAAAEVAKAATFIANNSSKS